MRVFRLTVKTSLNKKNLNDIDDVDRQSSPLCNLSLRWKVNKAKTVCKHCGKIPSSERG